MVIDQEIFDELTAPSKDSPRLRMYFDMQNSASDGIQLHGSGLTELWRYGTAE